jgi:hypothetical protein
VLLRKESEKMKKVSLFLVFAFTALTLGTTANAAEQISVTPEAGFGDESVLQDSGTEEAAATPYAASAPTVTYRTHIQKIGWQGWKQNGKASGTSGQSKRLEAIQLKVQNSPYKGDIQYRTHIQNIGWQSWKKNGQTSGTSGQSKRLEAIQIKLTGELGKKYDVFYRVHAQNFGWMGWEKGGLPAGTAKYAYRLEAIEVKLVPKKNYTTVNYSSKVSFREKKTYAGELDPKKLGVPNSYLKNGLKLFKDTKSLKKFVDAELNDPYRKTIYVKTYRITQGLKTIGYSAELFGPY